MNKEKMLNGASPMSLNQVQMFVNKKIKQNGNRSAAMEKTERRKDTHPY